jgi:crotonobetainyl-CoA:carnitine CoA-transferase CaiB-like acyl-CoA transferase
LQEVLDKLNDVGVSVAPVYTNKQIVEDPHFIERQAVMDVPDADFGTVKMPGVVPRLSGTPGAIHSSGPSQGAHNAQVYGEWLGLTPAQIEALRAAGAI